jgi:SAM-dependent methyltransferase
VLDFGCGTGGLLGRIDCARRVGIEIGDVAAEQARANGLEVHPTLSALEENSVDMAISFHAIEHVENPVAVVREIARVTKPNGLVRLIVPGEIPLDPRQAAWQPNADMHLYTWTPLNFGNLAAVAGMREISVGVAPMPTASRLVALLRGVPWLANLAHHRIAHRLNSWNVILNCRAPAATDA